MSHGKQNDPHRDMPSVTNRQWGPASRGDEAWSYGYEGQGGYGDFSQGGYGESQGRHAQSGHGRGGSEFVEGEPRAAGAGHRGRGPRNYTRSDASIVDELIDRMTDHERLDATEVLVNVENGVVTLTGEVPERRMKHLAEDLADAVRGVRDIENRIRVDNGADSFGEPGRGGVRSGRNQPGSGFSSSARIEDPIREETVRVGRTGVESSAPEQHVGNVQGDDGAGKSTGNVEKK